MLQQITGIIKVRKLRGTVNNTARPVFSLNDWWSGKYQEQMNKHLNDSFGFRPLFVQLNNQLDYSLARKIHANDVVEGKAKCLYEEGYIKALYGKDFMGNTVARNKLYKLKAIQDTLGKLGKTVVLVLAPSKARFYREFLPITYDTQTAKISNYETIKKNAQQIGINVLDFNGWFLKLKKDSAHYLLFSKQGIHWTKMGALLATDSLSHYLGTNRNVEIARLRINKMNYEIHPSKEQERDLFFGMNVIFPTVEERFNEPDYVFATKNAATKKEKAIFIGDSFLWTWYYIDYFNQTFDDWAFWYYYRELWTKNINAGSMKNYDYKKQLLAADVIVVLNTEVNLAGLGNGFIEETYEMFYGSK